MNATTLLIPALASVAFLIASAGAAEEPVPGQESEEWDLGELEAGKVYPTSVTVSNRSCKGRHSFEISVRDAPWFEVQSEARGIRMGQSRILEAKVDLTNTQRGAYQGSLAIRCVSCPPPPICELDVRELQIRVSVLVPGTDGISQESTPSSSTDRLQEATDEIANSPKVKEGFRNAWVKSLPEKASGGITKDEHEEGGWVVKDTKTGGITTFPTEPGKPNREKPNAVSLPSRPYYEDPDTKKKYADKEGRFEIVAGYHTHPFGGADRLTHPSDTDKKSSDKDGIPEYVVSEDGVYKYDPSKEDDPATQEDERVTQVEEKADTDRRNEAAKKAKGK